MKSGVNFRPPAIEWVAVLVLVAFVAVLAIAIFVVGFDQLTANLRRLSVTTLAISVVLMLWQSCCRSLRWFIYARSLGLKLPFPEAVLYYVAAFGMTLTPARLGEALRLWFLEKRFGVYYRRIAGLYLADRMGDAMAYLIFLVIGSVAYVHGSPAAWGFRLAVVAAIVAVVNPRPIIWTLNAAYALVRKGRKPVAWLRRAIRNTSAVFQPGVFLPGVAVGTLGWIAAPAVLTMGLAEMGVEINPLRAAAIFATAALAGGSTMMPGGGGATEAVLVVLLTASDVPLDIAVAAMLLTRLTFLWLPVGLGIALLPFAIRVARAAAKAR